MLKLGNKTVKGAKLGSHNILKVYRGSNLYADFTGGGGGGNTFTYTASINCTMTVNNTTTITLEKGDNVQYTYNGEKITSLRFDNPYFTSIDFTGFDMSTITIASSMFAGSFMLQSIVFDESFMPTTLNNLLGSSEVKEITCTKELKDLIYANEGQNQNLYVGKTKAQLDQIKWNIIYPPYYADPLTVEALGDGTLTFADHVPTDNLYVKVNGGDSQVMTADNKSVTVSQGDKVQLFNTSASVYYKTATYLFKTDFDYNISGNINSMYYGNDFIGKEDNGGIGQFMFSYWFYNNRVVDASKLILPYKILELSYYNWLFYGCSKLTIAPELIAKIVKNGGYANLFRKCSSIKYVKCLLEEVSESVLNRWLSETNSTGTIVKKRGVEYPIGESGIPSGWTVEEID